MGQRIIADRIIAYDLGTGGNKASLYDVDGTCLESTFVPYETFYPHTGWHEQCPEDWWRAVVESTRKLLKKRPDVKGGIACISISGHSLGVVPLDKSGTLLRDRTPIWSDTRSEAQVRRFFEKVDEKDWYMTTGNGFPPACYSLFKLMWYLDNEPGMYKAVHKILGTKDYINFRLTGEILTDHSYASGSGAYDLRARQFADRFFDAAGVQRELFPEIAPSTQTVGKLSGRAADTLGLDKRVQVICGGVDNSCMALGARAFAEGRVYISLGSSSWIAVTSRNPVLDFKHRPYVFTHVVPGMFTSAVSIFSAGSAFEWVKDIICRDLVEKAERVGRSVYELMGEEAEKAPPGANRLLFNPSLAGGSMQEATPHIRGGYAGLDLGHTRGHLIRSCMEGVAMNLGLVLEVLRAFCSLSGEMVIVGGGSGSRFWRQIFADMFDMKIVKTNIGRDAGSLGAAAVGAVGAGLWKDFEKIDEVHKVEEVVEPISEHVQAYRKLRPVFEYIRECHARAGDMLHQLNF